MRSRFLLSVALGLALCATAADASAGEPTTVGGGDGEIDLDVGFLAGFGNMEPYEREQTWQSPDIQAIRGGVGYSVGKLGPLSDFYLRLEGGYFNSAEEEVERAEDDLPVGYRFYSRDRGGWLTAVFGASFVHEPRYRFGAFVRGTVPIDVDLAKFSNLHFHYAAGGIDARMWITDPDWLLRLGYRSTSWLGSGAYLDGEQHNAAVSFENLLVFEAARWALPWRAGVSFGPIVEADLNSHINRAYNSAYASVTPDLVAGDRVRSMRLDFTVRPFVRVTEHAAVELGFTQTLFGYDLESTQLFTAGLRTAF